jgi:hypothetical protein
MPEIAPMKLNDLISDLNRAQKYLKDETEEPGAWLMSEDLRRWEAFLRSTLGDS